MRSHALPDVVAVDPQLVITATFVGLVVVLALGIALLVRFENRQAEAVRSRPPDDPGNAGREERASSTRDSAHR